MLFFGFVFFNNTQISCNTYSLQTKILNKNIIKNELIKNKDLLIQYNILNNLKIENI